MDFLSFLFGPRTPKTEPQKISEEILSRVQQKAGFIDCEEVAFILAQILFEKNYTVIIQIQNNGKDGDLEKAHAYVKWARGGLCGEVYKRPEADGWFDVAPYGKVLRMNNALREPETYEIVEIYKRDTDMRNLVNALDPMK